jgi:sulfopyruvate decarboxylase TPP-binding subunit
MKQNGVTDVIWLPDRETNWLYLLMQTDPDLRLIGLTREGHPCSTAAGLYAGDRKPTMLIQNTGMLESCDQTMSQSAILLRKTFRACH